MTRREDGSAGTCASAKGRDAPSPHPLGRLVQLDNLKAAMVAWIIFCHALLGYMAIGGWPYDEVNEVTVSPTVELVLSLVLGPSAFFIIGTFFFVAGLFTAEALRRHGRRGYLHSRLLRLGIPWMVFTLLGWPLCMWAAYLSAGQDVSFADAFRQRQPFLDSGPLWFLQVLLYASLLYVALGGRDHRRHLTLSDGAVLIACVAFIAAFSFVVRLWFPARSQQVLDLHLWQWPQCLAMFALGIVLSGRDWPDQIPRSLMRRCAVTVIATLVLMTTVAVLVGVTSFAADGAPFLGGWHWQALVLAVCEAVLVVTSSVLLTGLATTRPTLLDNFSGPWARAAFGAYVLQAPVLIGLAIAARWLPLPALVKALLVGIAAVTFSFWLASSVIRLTTSWHPRPRRHEGNIASAIPPPPAPGRTVG